MTFDDTILFFIHETAEAQGDDYRFKGNTRVIYTLAYERAESEKTAPDVAARTG